MGSRNKNDTSNITIIDAVETLSTIADMDISHDMGVAQKHQIMIQGQPVIYRSVHWLKEQEADVTVDLVKDTFRVILSYLRHFYQKEYGYVTDNQTIEGIKTIMVLVGEAAKKLDKYTQLFKRTKENSITELREYKKLQEFYLSRIAHKIDEGTLGKWILALTQRAMVQKNEVRLTGKKSTQTKHVFVDLESVKKDTEYELFFMRKEDGTRFFSPRLIRNIKLVSDFGVYFGENRGDDPLFSLDIWQDRCFNNSAKNILKSMGNLIEKFYHETQKFRERELVAQLRKTIMALMLSANQNNTLRNNPIKSCFEYFVDFQTFLRETLHMRDYEKLIVYPHKKHGSLAHCLLDTIHGLCNGLFTQVQGMQELMPSIQGLIAEASQAQSPEHREAVEASQQLWNRLSSDYAALAKLFKRHPNGPLKKVLEVLQDGNYNCYDPVFQNNIPNQLYSVYLLENKITNVRIPSPTNQEFIHKSLVTPEFIGFLRAYAKNHNGRKHLLINMQDRTSWKEHFRCTALEDLQENADFAKNIAVVTLANDTEFFNQLPPYNLENHVEVFMKHFREHLEDESAGYYFPKAIKKALLSGFVDGVMESIHKVFFGDKNVLPRERRLDFIEIFYMFLQLKLIELVKPDTFSFTCKDGIDLGATASAQLYTFVKILNGEKMTDQDLEQINLILYGPAVLYRERPVHLERFNRMISALKTIEGVRSELGAKAFGKLINDEFGNYYKTPILKTRIVAPKSA